MTAMCAGSGLATRRLWTGADEAKWLGWLDIVDEQRKADRQLDRAWPRMSGSRLHPRRAARHGRIEPRPGGVCRDVRASARSSRASGARLDRPGANPDDREQDRSCRDAVHRVEQVRQHARAEYPQAVLLRARDEGGRRRHRRARDFIAITDPGSPLQKIAERDRFRGIAFGMPSIGGRYSVLSDFGLVPAAAMGSTSASCSTATADDGALLRPPMCRRPTIQACVLGAVLGVLAAKAGRDKVTIVASPGHRRFRRLARTAPGRIDRQAGQGPHPGRRRAAGAACRLRTGSPVRLCAAVRRSRCHAGRGRRRARSSAGHPVVRIAVDGPLSHRPGILPLGDRHGRRGARSSASIRSTSPMSRPARSRRASSPTAYEQTARCRRKRRCWRMATSTLFADEAQRQGARSRRATAHARRLAEGASRAAACRRLLRAARLYRPQCRTSKRAAGHPRRDPRRANRSRPASVSGRVSCIRPAKPTRAAPTAACSLQITCDAGDRSSRCRATNTTFGVGERGAGARRLRGARPNAAGGRCACISATMSTAGSGDTERCRRQALLEHERGTTNANRAWSGWGGWARNIVRRLMRAGHECVVYDVRPQSVTELAKRRRGRRRRRMKDLVGQADTAARDLDDAAGGQSSTRRSRSSDRPAGARTTC